MKILLLTQWFEPEPVFKGLLFAKELASLGHEVTVLTGFPNYPGGKLYPGYRIRPWLREEMDGIRIVRVALYPSHDNSSPGRALNYLSFALAAAVLGTALIETPDVVYVYHPPATIALAAMAIGFFRRVPFVYDVQDLWPDSVAVSGMMSNRFVLGVLGAWCAFVYRHAARITVLSPGFRERLVSRGVPREKIDVIYNWCDVSAMRGCESRPERLTTPERFSILFAGTMGHAQELESVLRAAEICRERVPAAEFVFIGGGVDRPRLEMLAAQMQLTNVRFLTRQPMGAMGAILAGADALLVHLKDNPLFRITIPSKLQAYLAAGKPIVMAVRGDAADLLLRSGAGIVCRPGDPQSIADAVKQLVNAGPQRLAAMAGAGPAFYDREMSISTGVRKFERVLQQAVQGANRMSGLENSIPKQRVSPGFQGRFYRNFGKRTLDVIGAAAALTVFAPFMAFFAILIRARLGSPVLFRQQRPGLRGKPFVLLKFRTMTDATDGHGRLLPDCERLTGFGRFLRAASIDELPELLNVLRGEMSLVGPRPLLMQYLSRYSPWQAHRHSVRPGITGWAQVNGRNSIAWEEKFALDVWYTRHLTLLLDLKILWMTCLRVLGRSGVASEGHATMPEFMGTKHEA